MKPEPLTKGKTEGLKKLPQSYLASIQQPKWDTRFFKYQDVRSAYLWALKDMKEIETGFGKGNEELRQLLLNVCKLHRNTLKKAFEAVSGDG